MRLVLLFCACLPLMAQTNAGTVTGTVFDPSRAVVDGVKITVFNQATNVAQTATTNSSGVYSIPALEPGTYRAVVEKAGFQKLTREPIRVDSSSTVALDFTLSIGNAATEITVSEEIPLVQQATATVQYAVDLKQIDEQPLANQSALSLLALLPGVQGEPGTEQAAITTGLTTPGAGLSVSGSPMGTVQYQADGVNNTSMYYGRIALSFSTDAVSEVSVAQNSYSAEYRAAGGAIVGMTTKSGTNGLHGTVFSFTQNDVLNASPWLTYQKKGMLRYWRGGTDFGGPVVIPKLYNGRNKTFFFFGWEPLRQYTESQFFQRMATELERKGDFSKSIYNTAANQPILIFQHFDPGTNKQIVVPANTAYPQFPNNVIPASLISPKGSRLLNLQPLPNMPMNGLGANYSVMRSARNTDNRISIKGDQVLSANNRISVRYSISPTKGVRFNQGGLIEQVPTDRYTGTNAAFSDTYVWGGNKVNELRVGFMRANNGRTQTDEQLAINGFQQFGFPSYLDKGMPQIASFGDYGLQNMASSVGSYEIDNSLQLTDTLSWTKAKHSLKFGFDVQAPQQNLVDLTNVGGVWAFNQSETNIGAGNTLATVGIANATTGTGIASLLLGYPNSVSIAPAVIPYQYRWKYYAGFVQDDWKITPRLTLNLGVRYQVEVPRSEKHHKQGYFVNQPVTLPTGAQQQGYIQLHGMGGVQNTMWPARYNNIEPRIGFAWRVPAVLPGLKVVRAAYAITHVPTNGLFSSPIPDLNPKSAQLARNGSASGGQVQIDNAQLVLPTGGFVLPADGKFTNINNVNGLYYLNTNVTMPYVQQWNFGLGFQFGKDYGLEVNYVGNKSTNLFGPSAVFNAVDLDEYTRQFKAGINMGEQIPNPQGIVGANGSVINVSRQNALRPLSTLGDISDPLQQGFDARYNALQVNFTKRYSYGFQWSMNYTWMKSMDDMSCMGQFCVTPVQNWGTAAPQLYGDSHKLEKSVSVYDIPHTLRYNFSLDMPFGRGKWMLRSTSRAVNQIVGNWKVTGNGGYRSGYPFSVYSGTNAGFPDNVGKIRPNINSGVNPILPGWKANCNNPVTQVCPYMDSLALFSAPGYLQIGNAPRVIPYIRMPNVPTFNAAILKDFPIHEKIRLAFRAELYSAFNHPYFGTNQNNFTLYTGLTYTNGITPVAKSSNIQPAFASLSTNVGGRRTIQMGLKLYF